MHFSFKQKKALTLDTMSKDTNKIHKGCHEHIKNKVSYSKLNESEKDFMDNLYNHGTNMAKKNNLRDQGCC
jgi:hypothetical protein